MLTEIDQIVRQEIDLQGPGVAIAVVKDGKPVAVYISVEVDFRLY